MAPAYTPFLFPLSELISVFLSQFFLLRGWNTSAAPNCLLFVFASPGLIEALQTSTKGAFIARGPGNSSPGAGPSFSHRAFAHSLHTACSSPRSFGGGALTLTKAPTQRDIPRLSSQNLHPPPPSPIPSPCCTSSLLSHLTRCLTYLVYGLPTVPHYYVGSRRSGTFSHFVQSWIPSAQQTVNIQ